MFTYKPVYLSCEVVLVFQKWESVASDIYHINSAETVRSGSKSQMKILSHEADPGHSDPSICDNTREDSCPSWRLEIHNDDHGDQDEEHDEGGDVDPTGGGAVATGAAIVSEHLAVSGLEGDGTLDGFRGGRGRF